MYILIDPILENLKHKFFKKHIFFIFSFSIATVLGIIVIKCIDRDSRHAFRFAESEFYTLLAKCSEGAQPEKTPGRI